MPAISPCEYELITIESDQGVTIDLRLGVVSFQYFEDLFSPTITARMVIISTSGVVSDDKTKKIESLYNGCLLYTSPSPRDFVRSRMPSSA